MLRVSPSARRDRISPKHRGPSKRPALQYVGLLLLADRGIAERLLRGDPIDTAIAHPHYPVALDDGDRATLSDIRDRVDTVDELLAHIAEVADGALPVS
jgi:hypothetical protein